MLWWLGMLVASLSTGERETIAFIVVHFILALIIIKAQLFLDDGLVVIVDPNLPAISVYGEVILMKV